MKAEGRATESQSHGGAEPQGPKWDCVVDLLVPAHHAGAKRMAILRSAVASAGLRGTRVLQAACEDELAGTRLADGTLRITPNLCDALIELMATLKSDPARHEIALLAIALTRHQLARPAREDSHAA